MNPNVAFNPAAAEAKARFETQTTAQLQRQCERLNITLPVGAGKVELVNRLVEHEVQQVRAHAKAGSQPDGLLLPPLGKKRRQPELSISGLDLAALKRVGRFDK